MGNEVMEVLHHHKHVHVYDDALRTSTDHIASLPDDINMVTVADAVSEGLWEHIMTNSEPTWLHPQYGAEKSPSACQTLLSAYMCNGLCVSVALLFLKVCGCVWHHVREFHGGVCVYYRGRERQREIEEREEKCYSICVCPDSCAPIQHTRKKNVSITYKRYHGIICRSTVEYNVNTKEREYVNSSIMGIFLLFGE